SPSCCSALCASIPSPPLLPYTTLFRSFVVGATVARLFSGYLVDAFGRRRVLWISLVVVAASSVGYLLEGSFWVLILVRMLHGLSYAIASTSVMSTAQRVIAAAFRAEGTGLRAKR